MSCCLQESEAVDLASKLDDRAWALEQLLGPTLQPEGASNRLKSEEARALTQHLYTHDRWVGTTRGEGGGGVGQQQQDGLKTDRQTLAVAAAGCAGHDDVIVPSV